MSFNTTRGKVPQFSMRPHPAVSGMLIFVLIIGPLSAMSFLIKEDGTGINHQRATLILIATGILTICLTIAATSKFWFPHLWKKNSTHARHKQHTKHHPSMRNAKPRRR